jgi:hypothetical protein
MYVNLYACMYVCMILMHVCTYVCMGLCLSVCNNIVFNVPLSCLLNMLAQVLSPFLRQSLLPAPHPFPLSSCHTPQSLHSPLARVPSYAHSARLCLSVCVCVCVCVWRNSQCPSKYTYYTQSLCRVLWRMCALVEVNHRQPAYLAPLRVCACVRVCVCDVCVCIYTYVYKYEHLHLHLHLHIRIHTYIYIHTLNMHIYTSIYMTVHAVLTTGGGNYLAVCTLCPALHDVLERPLLTLVREEHHAPLAGLQRLGAGQNHCWKVPQRRTRSAMAFVNSGAARRRTNPAFMWYSSPEGGHGGQERSHHSEAPGAVYHLRIYKRLSSVYFKCKAVS